MRPRPVSRQAAPFSRASLAGAAIVAGHALAPARLPAQPAQARAFNVCVLGTFQTCSALTLTTAAAPGGTAVSIAVRQTTRSPRATGLSGLSVLFPGATGADGDAAPGRPVLTAAPGLALPGGVPLWTVQGYPARLDLLHDPVTPGTPAGESQFVAGCAGGAFAGGYLVTTLSTCLPGAAYRFAFTTNARFAAPDVTGFAFDLYAGADADAPNGRTVTCTFDALAPLAGQCLDFADLADPVVPFGPVPSAVIPEPGALALVGSGLVGLAVLARRRRA